ncbi:MAG: FAD-binding oxidoreductase [Gammaproteobacteria bacterium]|nr:FAD-binding oxidoreductase [Gammaproteobacteria bacterium]
MTSLNWGNYPNYPDQKIISQQWRDESPFLVPTEKKYLPHGNGRSYGDSCLNDNGILINMLPLNHVISFDKQNGVLHCEAGVLLGDILSLIVPEGWILPVLPGTKFITVGGAIANDVHGKNHHKVGTFSCHISQFELLRSDGSHVVCSAIQNKELYTATIGGLGLTGIIIWAEIKLMPIKSAFLSVETIPFHGADEFLKLAQESEESHLYTVAWLDCQARGKKANRGLFMRANHLEGTGAKIPKPQSKTVPIYFPAFVLNRWTISVFNKLYYYLGKKKKQATVYFDKFFFPLDNILSWNKIYGKKGFLQYQFVIPYGDHIALQKILDKITQSGMGSFLSVLKTFGDVPSPGMLSFPMSGITLALDFPNCPKTFTLLNALDAIVMEVEGRVYPAKDARMSSAAFKKYFPKYKEFEQLIDPKISSSFWRRVIQEG